MLILLVDDNSISLDLQRLMIESYGLPVDTATSGEQAVKLAKAHDYVIIFMDIKMPGIDGFNATKQIREFNKKVAIIGLSADVISRDNPDFISSGMSDVLQKPLSLIHLKKILSIYFKLAEDSQQWRRKTDIIFDKEELLSVLSDERAMHQILEQFLTVHRQDGERIIKLIQNGNYSEAHFLLHDIIGVAGNLYCSRLYESGTKLNNELKRGQANDAIVSQFSNVWYQTIGHLSECCNALSIKYKPEIDENTDWETIWSDFCELCREFDMMATEIFNKNITLFSEHLDADSVEFLKKAVNAYDYLAVIDYLG